MALTLLRPSKEINMEKMPMKNEWVDFIVELQSLAQAGLAYSKDVYDIERFERIRELSALMMSKLSDTPPDTVRELFCNEYGYQTPKLDTRAAIFEDGKISLVHENNGKWSLPGGWCDVNVSVGENAVKEVKEEAGLDVSADRIIAVQDRSKHNLPQYAYGVCKIFVECSVLGGSFVKNSETTEFRYFSMDDLPPLSEEKNTEEQIKMCFDAHEAQQSWRVIFD